METATNPNLTGNQPQGNIRAEELRRWMYLNNVTLVDIGRVCGITPNAVMASLNRERMPVRHHKAIIEAYPELPAELLPEPRDVPSGPGRNSCACRRPCNASIVADTHTRTFTPLTMKKRRLQ